MKLKCPPKSGLGEWEYEGKHFTQKKALVNGTTSERGLGEWKHFKKRGLDEWEYEEKNFKKEALVNESTSKKKEALVNGSMKGSTSKKVDLTEGWLLISVVFHQSAVPL